MKNRIGIGLLILLVVALVAIPEASAFGSIKTTFLTKYSLPTSSPLNICDTCHTPAGTSTWNSYGTDLQTQMATVSASQGMTNIEPVDSDGDGFTNLQELTAVPPTFPGDALSFPPTSDTTPPVITMLGSTPIDIVVGSVYTDAGATATDNVDGSLTSAIVTVNSVNTAVIGTYTVTYNVADAAGNKAVEVVRTVNIVAAAPDTTPPVITMLGSTPIDSVVGSVYVDAGATAIDNKDGDLTAAIVTVNSVNTAVIGTYTVTYNVADAAGNKAVEVVRTVNIVEAAPDTTPPVITMLGSTPIDIVVGSVYVDAGATALDNKDGDLTSAIVTVNSVNTAVIGTYTVTYNVADAAGNKAVEVVRTVNVVEAAPPGDKGTVKFVVTDSKTGKPIHDAKVTLGKKTIMTNDDGIAIFSNVNIGNYNYKVTKDHYKELKGKISVVAGDQTVNVKLVSKKKQHDNDEDHKDKNKITEKKKDN